MVVAAAGRAGPVELPASPHALEEFKPEWAARPVVPVSLALFARAVPGLAEQFKRVPPEYCLGWPALRLTVVRCVCGHLVYVVGHESLVPCLGGCGRAFVRSGPVVYRAPWPKRGEED